MRRHASPGRLTFYVAPAVERFRILLGRVLRARCVMKGMQMRAFRWLFLTSILVFVAAFAASCRSQQQPEQKAPAAEGPAPVATVREIMHNIVEYNAFKIFNSVAVT